MKDEAKHTAGPWTVEPLLTPERDDDPMGVYKVQPAFDNLTEKYFASEPETKELEAVHAENAANAHLIAAAPSLLDTLEWTLEQLNNLTTDAYSKGGDRAVRNRLQETINKARGQG